MTSVRLLCPILAACLFFFGLCHSTTRKDGKKVEPKGLSEECGRTGHELVVVIGDPAYYRRFGFFPAKPQGLDCEFDAPDDVFMVLGLSKDALEGTNGIVKYQPEFKTM